MKKVPFYIIWKFGIIYILYDYIVRLSLQDLSNRVMFILKYCNVIIGIIVPQFVYYYFRTIHNIIYILLFFYTKRVYQDGQDDFNILNNKFMYHFKTRYRLLFLI